MSKKYLRKNEFRMDLNPAHYGKKEKPHPAYITAKRGHKYKANSITHARFVNNKPTKDFGENPNKTNKLNKDLRVTRLSQPFWQNATQFSEVKLTNFRFSNRTRKKIRKYNKNFR